MIAEPMTLLTDYALAAVSGYSGWRLLLRREAQASRRWWAIAFGGLACAAALGGTHHGFAPLMNSTVAQLVWKLTVLGIGAFSFGMVAGSAVAVTTGALRHVVLAAAGVKLAGFWAWMLAHDEYRYVIVDTAAAMTALVVLHGWSYAARRDRASAWTLAAVAVSGVAAAVQASGFALHQHFNHNDLYHVIQIAAMTLFYKGATLLRDHLPSSPRLQHQRFESS